MRARATPPLLLTPSFMGNDGASRLSRELGSSLTQLFGEAHVWSWTDPSPAPGTEIVCRGAARRSTRIARWALRESLHSQRQRLVLVVHTHLAPVALPLRARGATVVQFLLGLEVFGRVSAFRRASLRKASRLVSISRYTSDEFRRANPEFYQTAVEICHPGLPDVPFAPAPPRGRFALIVGRLSPDERYKGHDELLEAWPELLRRVPEAELVVVGGGADRERLEAKARGLGLERRVRFEGSVPDESLRRLYAECQFFVMPSRKEGFGLVFLEAMRAGKPVIGAVGAASEIIENGLTGFVVQQNGRELVERLAELFASPERCREMGLRARQAFLDRFTAEHLRERLSAILTHARR